MTDERQSGPSHPSPPAPQMLPPDPVPAPRTRAQVRSATEAGPARAPARDDQPHSPRGRRRWLVVVLAVALVLALAAAGYLLALSQRWADRAADLEAGARDLGTELAHTRADLESSANTLVIVERQLDGAREQIHELADTVAQTGDDREVQRQVLDYQAQVSAAAAAVAEAMDQCINSQQELIDVLEEAATTLNEQAASPAPAATPAPRMTLDLDALDEYRSEVTTFCQQAQDANENLQDRLESS